jgi:hypothetical protein
MDLARRLRERSIALWSLVHRENATFLPAHRESGQWAAHSAAHWLGGLPMHWMADWHTSHPLLVNSACAVVVVAETGAAGSPPCCRPRARILGFDGCYHGTVVTMMR